MFHMSYVPCTVLYVPCPMYYVPFMHIILLAFRCWRLPTSHLWLLPRWVAAHAVLCLSSAWRPRAASGREHLPLSAPCTAYRACTMYHVPCTKYHLYIMHRAVRTVYRVPCGALIVFYFLIFLFSCSLIFIFFIFIFLIVVVRIDDDDDDSAVFFQVYTQVLVLIALMLTPGCCRCASQMLILIVLMPTPGC